MSLHRGTRGVMGICSLGWFFLLLFSGTIYAGECQQWVAKAVSIQGIVQVQRAGKATWEAVAKEDLLCTGDVLRVLEKSRAALVLRNEAVIRLDEKTTLTIKPETGSKALLLRLLDGAVHFFSRMRYSLNVATPFVNGAVEGTEFFVRVTEGQTYFSVFRGRVRVENPAGELLLADNTTATVAKGQAPVLKAVARPRDAVNWALYYPAIVPTEKQMISKQLISASELLQVGRVDAAQKILRQIITNDPNSADALALSAIIELVQNRKEKARSLAEKAIELEPDSTVAKMALAYVRQAFFDVEAARDILEEAASVDPQNGLLWARLSELWLATGYQGKALSAAKKATALSPDTSRSQTVLGFAYISQIKIDRAKTAFQKAIELDQADPLPRLGLGLALIRGGDLEAGRRQLEIAAALDAGNALVRSYLGKAFYDEKENALALRQYEVATELDPNDPTPYFYSAILKLTANRPVEALDDLQTSIELNDQRAVYRSKLLIDEDLAARSAGLARIYDDLGFRHLALSEGCKAVNTDPANFSAHRFLADAYATQPRHEIARVSELLQGQLLQPINITPVQPQLATGNLFLVEGAGPSEPAFNEFHPLFLRNRFAVQANGVAGEHDTYGYDLIQSTVWNQLSYSVGAFHYETDGFRENNDRDQDIANAFVQVSIAPSTSLQGEYRYSDTENGDLEQRFYADDFRPGQRKQQNSRLMRFGLHHRFAPHADMIGSFIFENKDSEANLTESSAVYNVTTEDEIKGDTYLTELQYLFGHKPFKLLAGGGYLKSDFDRKTLIQLVLDPTAPPMTMIDYSPETDIQHTNLYLYTHIYFPKKVRWTIGASADFFEEDEGGESLRDRNQVNPKMGLTWHPFRGTVLRAAAFRMHRRSLTLTNQTLEPTQVAGFNQFYDDVPGTDAWRYGFAADQKISKNLFAGVEYSKRELEVLVRDFTPPDSVHAERVDREEHTGRAYLYWAPCDWVALKGEYLYERLERGSEHNKGVETVETHRFPLGANFFLPKGWQVKTQATYFSQHGRFNRIQELNLPAESGRDQFWIIDASIGYRLPQRFGTISLEAKNLFDTAFDYYDSDLVNPVIQPERLVMLKVNLSL